MKNSRAPQANEPPLGGRLVPSNDYLVAACPVRRSTNGQGNFEFPLWMLACFFGMSEQEVVKAQESGELQLDLDATKAFGYVELICRYRGRQLRLPLFLDDPER